MLLSLTLLFRNTNDVLLNIRQNFFNKNTFFPSAIIEWNKLDLSIWNLRNFSSFKERIHKFIRPAPNSIFQCHNSKEIKCLTRLWVKFSHFRENKFKYLFQNTINLLCTCSREVEKNHVILHFPYYENERHILLVSIRNIKSSILDENDDNLVKIVLYGLNLVLYGLNSLNETQNTNILNVMMEFLKSSNRFQEQLF